MALIPQSNDPLLFLILSQRGTNDTLVQTGAHLVGDRHTITDFARGGNDGLTGTLVYGDGFAMLEHARGGNDRLTSAGLNASLFRRRRHHGRLRPRRQRHARRRI